MTRHRRANLSDDQLVAKVLGLFTLEGNVTRTFLTIRDHFMDRSREILERMESQGLVKLRTRRARSAQSVSDSGMQIQTVWVLEPQPGVTLGQAADALSKLSGRLLTPTMTKAGLGLDQGPIGHVSASGSVRDALLDVTFTLFLVHPNSAMFQSAMRALEGRFMGQNQTLKAEILKCIQPQDVVNMLPAQLRSAVRMDGGVPEVKADAKRGSMSVVWEAKAVPISQGAVEVSFRREYELVLTDVVRGVYELRYLGRSSARPEQCDGLTQAADRISSDLFGQLSSWFKGVEQMNPIQVSGEYGMVSNPSPEKGVAKLRGMKFRLTGRGDFKFMRAQAANPYGSAFVVTLPPVLARPMVSDPVLRKEVLVSVSTALDAAFGREQCNVTEWDPRKGTLRIGFPGIKLTTI